MKSSLQYSRHVKRTSNLRTSKYMFEFRFFNFRYSYPTCTKTDVCIEVLLSHNRLQMRLECLCSLLAAATRVTRRFTRRLMQPPSMLLVFDYPSRPPHLSLPLRSHRTVCLLSCCCSQCLPWLIRIMCCVMKQILADIHKDWRSPLSRHQ